MKERDRWNKGQTVYARNDWPRRRLHILESKPMLASTKPSASEPWDSPTMRELVPWPAPGRVTWHRLGGGDPGDPTALVEGPGGAVVVGDELAGPWHVARYGVVVRAPGGGKNDRFIALWLPREGGHVEVSFSVPLPFDEALHELMRYELLGYKGSVVKANELVTYPG